jgi:hypothetical protein
VKAKTTAFVESAKAKIERKQREGREWGLAHASAARSAAAHSLRARAAHRCLARALAAWGR